MFCSGRTLWRNWCRTSGHCYLGWNLLRLPERRCLYGVEFSVSYHYWRATKINPFIFVPYLSCIIPLNGSFLWPPYIIFMCTSEWKNKIKCVYRPKCDFTLFLDPVFIFLPSKLVLGFCRRLKYFLHIPIPWTYNLECYCGLRFFPVLLV